MAEAIILPLAKSILCNIASFFGNLDADEIKDLVDEEIKAFKSFKKDLKAIAESLESISSVLHDAESKQYSNEAMRIWLRHLKNVLYDIDDLLDEVATDSLQRNLNEDHFFTRTEYYLSLSHKIKGFRLELDRIAVMKSKFGLTNCFVEAPNVENCVDIYDFMIKIPIVDNKDNIIMGIRRLGESSLSVFPVLGIGGTRKITVAKLVFDDINQFDVKLWVCVSGKFDIQKILQDILKDATCESTLDYTLGELVERVQYVLKGKKFFLVFDDFWEDDIRLWNELKHILNVGEKGSVILITTRTEKVDLTTKTVKSHVLDKLSNSLCWSIFMDLALPDGDEEKYPRLSEIGISIVENCSGILPVIQWLGTLLSSEREEGEWLRIKNMYNLAQLDGRYETVKRLLKLSYDKLPSHLKPHFAHLSLYPKGKDYGLHYLFYTFSALGLHQLKIDSYFNYNIFDELLSRSMLRVIHLAFTYSICRFDIHDLLHDLAGDILREELAVITKNKLSVPDSSRYIAWGFKSLSNQIFPTHIKARKARGFIFQFEMKHVSQSFLNGIISSFPRLRFLEFGSSQFEELPSSIGSLKHLRVLNLSNNRLIKSLPTTLCELLNLECLSLDGCNQLAGLPPHIYKLSNLRFITLTCRERSFVEYKLNRLPALQHISFVFCNELECLWDGEDDIFLTSLRMLWIIGCTKLIKLPNKIKLLGRLQYLRINHCKSLDLESGEALSGLLSLQAIEIVGIPRLTCLPNAMRSAAISLKYILISDCIALTELPDWLGFCVSLQILIIKGCQNLLSLPAGIFCLNSLIYLYIRSCPHISQSSAGGYLALFRHIPEIWLDNCLVTHNQQ